MGLRRALVTTMVAWSYADVVTPTRDGTSASLPRRTRRRSTVSRRRSRTSCPGCARTATGCPWCGRGSASIYQGPAPMRRRRWSRASGCRAIEGCSSGCRRAPCCAPPGRGAVRTPCTSRQKGHSGGQRCAQGPPSACPSTAAFTPTSIPMSATMARAGCAMRRPPTSGASTTPAREQSSRPSVCAPS